MKLLEEDEPHLTEEQKLARAPEKLQVSGERRRREKESEGGEVLEGGKPGRNVWKKEKEKEKEGRTEG